METTDEIVRNNYLNAFCDHANKCGHSGIGIRVTWEIDYSRLYVYITNYPVDNRARREVLSHLQSKYKFSGRKRVHNTLSLIISDFETV